MRQLFAILLFVFPLPLFSQSTVFFSEYVEGTSNNKALEIYNGTENTIDLALDNYVIQMYFNGNTVSTLSIPLKGLLPSKGALVVLHRSYALALPSQGQYMIDSTNTGWYNGDDALVLRKGGTTGEIKDVIGQVGVDPGASWASGSIATADQTLRRKLFVGTGDTSTTNVFDPVLEWESYATNTVSGLGTHTATSPALFTHIGHVQGDSSVSKLIGSKVEVIGVVTMDLQKTEEQKGFYLQDSSDHNPSTSDGIFVYDPTQIFDVKVGQTLKVIGEVAEFSGQTELQYMESYVKLSDAPLFSVDTASVSFPVDSVNSFEKWEGMLVKFSQKLVVTENYNLGRYGELTLSFNDRLFQPTEILDLNDANPNGTTSAGQSNLPALLNRQQINLKSQIVLADYSSLQNPTPIPFIDSVSKTIRCGSSLSQLRGVLTFGFGYYAVHALQTPKFAYAARPSVPDMADAHVLVAGMNVLNFFNGDGTGGGFPTSRGALTRKEFTRQKAKITAALSQLNADIVGLMEMENDGANPKPALNELVDTLNQVLGAGTYAFIPEPVSNHGNAGTDEIKVALMYKPSKVSPVTSAWYYNDAAFTGLGRPPLAQTFQHTLSGDRFNVIVNHFKSKGCTDATGIDLDQMDGQGCFTATRKKQAEALLQFIGQMIQASNDSDIVTIGDFNSYSQEDPLDVLRAGKLINLTENTYSYAFDTQFGSLDHAFVSASLNKKVIKASKWHINSDEPPVIDYTLTSKKQDLYLPSPYRSSDHDPVLVGFRFQPVTTSLFPSGQEEVLKIYPNPGHQGTLYLSETSSGKVLDSFGRLVHIFDQRSEIDTSLWAKGVYYVQIKDGKTLKVIVQ